MFKFKIGDIVVFNDSHYAEHYSPSIRFLGKSGVIINIKPRSITNDILIKVKFENGILEAFDFRFSFINRGDKTPIEIKVNELYERQPYYKNMKGREQCTV